MQQLHLLRTPSPPPSACAPVLQVASTVPLPSAPTTHVQPAKQRKARRRDLSSLTEQLEEAECLETMYPDGSYDELRDHARSARREPEAAASLQALHLSVKLPLSPECSSDCSCARELSAADGARDDGHTSASDGSVSLEIRLELPEGYPLKRPPVVASLSCPSLSPAAMAQLQHEVHQMLSERQPGAQALVTICEGARRRASKLVHQVGGAGPSTADGSGGIASAASTLASVQRAPPAKDKWGEKLSRKIVLNHSTHLDGLLPTLVKLDEACSHHGLVVTKMVPAQLKRHKGAPSTAMSLQVRERALKLSGFELRAHKGMGEQIVFLVIRGFDREDEVQTEKQLGQLQAAIAECAHHQGLGGGSGGGSGGGRGSDFGSRAATSTSQIPQKVIGRGQANGRLGGEAGGHTDEEPSDAERAAAKARILALEDRQNGPGRCRGLDDDLGPRPQDLNAGRAKQMADQNKAAHKERFEQSLASQKQSKEMHELASAQRKLHANKDFMKSSGIRGGTSDKAYNSKDVTGERIMAAARDAKERGRV